MKTYYWLNQNRFLSHLRTSFCAFAIAGASLTLPSAGAGTPQLASGQFFPCFNILNPLTDIQQAGPNTIITFHITGTSTGTLTGSVLGTELDVTHPDGYITFEGNILFTTADNSGTMLFTYTGEGNANPSQTVHGLPPGHETLRFVGTQGTGSLSGVYAQITAEGGLVFPPASGCYLSGAGTYSGQIVYAP